jgi:hypothetical protein
LGKLDRCALIEIEALLENYEISDAVKSVTRAIYSKSMLESMDDMLEERISVTLEGKDKELLLEVHSVIRRRVSNGGYTSRP